MRIFVFFVLFFLSAKNFSQQFAQIKIRFDSYLNYKGGLDKYVEITPQKLTFYKYVNAKKEEDFVLSKDTWATVAELIKFLPVDSSGSLYQMLKGKQNFGVYGVTSYKQKNKSTEKPLSGIKIMIDPGHIAGNMKMAETEQKYLRFTKEVYPDLKTDSINIAEGVLTFQTASILKIMLEREGATVSLSRKNNATTFGLTYEDWYKNKKKKTLDSLLKVEKINAKKYKWLMHMGSNTFFVEFFKDYELQNRARLINSFSPNLTVIIHYNVNEKNVPWIKPSDKDFCMAFIPGCITDDNVQTAAGKINLLRLLLTNDVDECEKISSLLVNELSKQLNVPIAKSSDASYLSEHCTSTASAGVYCRNLALCRLVQSPLVYGECLYQDSENECYELIKNTEDNFGIKTNKRVVLAAQSFYSAIMKYYSN